MTWAPSTAEFLSTLQCSMLRSLEARPPCNLLPLKDFAPRKQALAWSRSPKLSELGTEQRPHPRAPGRSRARLRGRVESPPQEAPWPRCAPGDVLRTPAGGRPPQGPPTKLWAEVPGAPQAVWIPESSPYSPPPLPPIPQLQLSTTLPHPSPLPLFTITCPSMPPLLLLRETLTAAPRARSMLERAEKETWASATTRNPTPANRAQGCAGARRRARGREGVQERAGAEACTRRLVHACVRCIRAPVRVQARRWIGATRFQREGRLDPFPRRTVRTAGDARGRCPHLLRPKSSTRRARARCRRCPPGVRRPSRRGN